MPRKTPEPKPKSKGLHPSIIVAVITLIGTIVTALLSASSTAKTVPGFLLVLGSVLFVGSILGLGVSNNATARHMPNLKTATWTILIISLLTITSSAVIYFTVPPDKIPPLGYQTPTTTPTNTETSTPTTTVALTTTSPTANPPMPRIYNFIACKEPCNGGNSSTSFASVMTKIYLEWDYENIPYGASYIRKWTMDGREWIKYDCTWTGSENGRESIKLTEPKGLHSGTWELTIIVDGNVLLSEQINVSGSWDYWNPAGTLNSCYGTND